MRRAGMLLLGLLWVVLCSCSSVPGETDATREPAPSSSSTTTVASTDAPEATVTPVPLSELDLGGILYQEGDLPAGLSPAQIRDFAPAMYDELPASEQEAYMQFERDGDPARGVAVFLYASGDAVQEAFNLVVDGLAEPESTDKVGEEASQSRLIIRGIGAVEMVDLVFVRCSALVHISMAGTSDLDAAMAYARSLDGRIEPLVCR